MSSASVAPPWSRSTHSRPGARPRSRWPSASPPFWARHDARSTSRYDLRLPDEPGDIVAGALRAAAARGVTVRIAYNADHDERIFPPPPRTKPDLLEALPLRTIGISRRSRPHASQVR